MRQTKTVEKEKRRKEVLDYANRLSATLSARKRLSILEADIGKSFKKLEYIRHKIDQKTRLSEETITAIKEIEPELVETRNLFLKIEPEQKRLETEYLRLLDIQKNLDDKKNEGIKNRKQIAALNADIEKIHENMKIFEGNNREITAKIDEINEHVDSGEKKLEKLRAEIEINKNTKEMMKGIKPESIGDEEFKALMTNDDNIEAYQEEATGISQKMKDDISDMKLKIPDFVSRETELTSSIDDIKKQINTLKSKKVTGKNRETLLNEINLLKQKHNDLTLNDESDKQEKQMLASKISAAKESLSKEKDIEKGLRESLEYFGGRKQAMDQFEDIDAEMLAMGQRIESVNRTVTGNKNFMKIIDKVKQEIQSLNQSLSGKMDEHLSELNRYINILLIKQNT